MLDLCDFAMYWPVSVIRIFLSGHLLEKAVRLVMVELIFYLINLLDCD